MKKRLLLLVSFALLYSVKGFSQNALDPGKFAIDAYYGFPNLITSYEQTAINNGKAASNNSSNGGAPATNVSARGVGPLGLRIMYMLGEKVGLGIDFNYANSILSWNQINNGVIYYYKIEIPRFRIMPSFEYHIRQTANFDFYYMLRIGYAGWNPNFTTNDPNSTPSSVQFSVPFAFRTGIGARYYFTPYFGANMDFGFFGGGLIQAGLSTKF